MRVATKIELDAATERELRVLSRRRRIEARVQQRARVILLAAEGWRNKDIASKVALDRRQVALWRRRFLEGGIDALRQDAPRAGRTPVVTPELESRILTLTLHPAPGSATTWSARTLAAHLDLSATTIRRVWQRNGLRPHAARRVRLTRDPDFEGKPLEVVGLYLNAPEHALVLGCDERNGFLVEDGEPPARSMETGRAAPPARGDEGHGRRPLSAALDALDGAIISRCEARPRHETWLKFLRLVDRKTPRRLTLHLIVDGREAHGHPDVQAWLARHSRIVTHDTPTRASWRERVERFLHDLPAHRVDCASCARVAELEQAIARHVADHDAHPGPFVWTARPPDVPRQAARARTALAGARG